VTFESGGFGAETAAPAARRIIAALEGLTSEQNEIVRGSDRSR
jgi:hypothetical protein